MPQPLSRMSTTARPRSTFVSMVISLVFLESLKAWTKEFSTTGCRKLWGTTIFSAAGQRCWQLLPLGPTGYGDSPYSPFSTFAGNPYYVDLEELADRGLLTRQELESGNWGDDGRQVDYGALYGSR